MKKSLMMTCFALFFLFTFQCTAQNAVTGEHVSKLFKMARVPEGMTEKKIKAFLAEHSAYISDCSFNEQTGALKIRMDESTPIVDVMRIFYNNSCPLFFNDSDGTQKKYDPKTDDLTEVR